MTSYATVEHYFDNVTPPSAQPGEIGEVVDMGEVRDDFAVLVVVAGEDSDLAQASLLGSIDNDHWYPLNGTNNLSNASMWLTNNYPARYLRITTYAAQGSPIVSAWVVRQ